VTKELNHYVHKGMHIERRRSVILVEIIAYILVMSLASEHSALR